MPQIRINASALPLSGCTRCIITETGIEAREVELVVDQVIHAVFKGAGQKLPMQVYGKKPRAGVDVFVARRLLLQNIARTSTLIFNLVRGKMRHEDTFSTASLRL